MNIIFQWINKLRRMASLMFDSPHTPTKLDSSSCLKRPQKFRVFMQVEITPLFQRSNGSSRNEVLQQEVFKHLHFLRMPGTLLYILQCLLYIPALFHL